MKTGWSWPAFLFGPFWALGNGLTWIGCCTLIGGFISVQLARLAGAGADLRLFSIVLIAVALVFGANGNIWRERSLVARGFKPDMYLGGALSAVASGPNLVFHGTIWSQVIAGTIVAGISAVISLLLGKPTVTSSAAGHLSPRAPIVTCASATIFGTVYPNGTTTAAWFEWGESADLANETVRQQFTRTSSYQQELNTLKEDTRYWWRGSVSNPYGSAKGRVDSFTTPHCSG